MKEQNTAVAEKPQQTVAPAENAIATVNQGAGEISVTQAQALRDLMTADAGQGTEYKASELAIPFLSVLQGLSPEVNEANPKYIEGAKPGMLFNTVTREVFDIRCLPGKPDPAGLPVVYGTKCTKRFVEWIPRDNGGGFVAQHAENSEVHQSARPDPVKATKLKLANGNDLVETDYHYPIVCSDPQFPSWAVIGQTSTQLKSSRITNSFIQSYVHKERNFKPAIFAMVFRLFTVLKTKAENSWWVLEPRFVGLVDEAFSPEDATRIYIGAKAYGQAVKGGLVNVTPPPTDGPGTGEDIPF